MFLPGDHLNAQHVAGHETWILRPTEQQINMVSPDSQKNSGNTMFTYMHEFFKLLCLKQLSRCYERQFADVRKQTNVYQMFQLRSLLFFVVIVADILAMNIKAYISVTDALMNLYFSVLLWFNYCFYNISGNFSLWCFQLELL